MQEIMIWVWMGVFVAFIIFEAITFEFIGIWFALASLVSLVLSLIPLNWELQVVIFILVTLLLLLLTRPIVMRYIKTNEIKTNVDSYIGQTGFVTESITKELNGRVKLKGLDWSAKSNDTILEGTEVKVIDVEGNKLIVEEIK